MLSACLIVRDGSRTLGDCLSSLQGLVDEIIVVMDPRTRDTSESIAADFGARIFTRNFDNFAAQKNFAISKANGPWILAIDADETIPPNLKLEILTAISKTTVAGFVIPRLNRIMGRDIYHTNWGPEDDSHIWLFKKEKGRWVGLIHEEVEVTGKIGRLHSFKLHQSYRTVSEFLAKTNYYTSFTDGIEFSFARMWFTAIRDFGRRYFWHQGFLDGFHGLFLSYLMAIYHLSAFIKAWQKNSSPS